MYDLNTPAGMRAAMEWTQRLLGMLRDGGAWAIPRSGAMVTSVNHKDKTCELHHAAALGKSEHGVKRVLETLGWKVTEVRTTGGSK